MKQIKTILYVIIINVKEAETTVLDILMHLLYFFNVRHIDQYKFDVPESEMLHVPSILVESIQSLFAY